MIIFKSPQPKKKITKNNSHAGAVWYSLQSRYRRAGHGAYGPLYNRTGNYVLVAAAHWKQLQCANAGGNQKSIDSH